MLYGLVMVIHVIVCLVLVFVVLLQAGRGGGFSDMLGGGQPQSLFGTQTNAFMVKATEVCAVLFIVTSLALGMLSTQQGKSLVEKQRLMRDIQAAMPSSQQGPLTPAAEAPKAPEAPPLAVDAASQPAPPAAADAKTT